MAWEQLTLFAEAFRIGANCLQFTSIGERFQVFVGGNFALAAVLKIGDESKSPQLESSDLRRALPCLTIN
jgi:hypothetical protein